MLEDMAIFWMIVMCGFVVIEVISSSLVSLWFAAGSVAALIASNYRLEFQW